VLDNETVSRITFQTLSKYPNEKHRYTMAAQELVAKSRGRANESGHWRLADCKAPATVDDISVIVIPIYQYYKEFCEWEKRFFEAQEYQRKLAAEALLKAEEKENENNGSIDEDAEEAEEATDAEKSTENGSVEGKLESITLTDESNGETNESTA
jgi:protein phosphatase 1H